MKRARRNVLPLLTSALVGYELCARRTTDPNVAVAVKNAAESLAKLVGVQPKARTSERLRWEYVASTGALMRGADARLLAECARILGDALALAPSDQRVRLASAEAWSLAAAVAPIRRAAIAPAFA
jgi:hypothetical protein